MATPTALLTKRFGELEQQGRAIRQVRSSGSDDSYAEEQSFYAWSGSALNAIQAAFGPDSPHAQRFAAEIKGVSSNKVWSRHLSSILGVFLGAKSDLDGGYVFNLEKQVAGELFGDIVALAKRALSDGHHTVAAVLGCAALEDALKRFAATNGLNVGDKAMEEVINALKAAGLVSGAQKGLLGAMPKIRNHALHAEWDKISAADAGSVLGFVEQFLLSNF
jgi:hypothetical protein